MQAKAANPELAESLWPPLRALSGWKAKPCLLQLVPSGRRWLPPAGLGTLESSATFLPTRVAYPEILELSGVLVVARGQRAPRARRSPISKRLLLFKLPRPLELVEQELASLSSGRGPGGGQRSRLQLSRPNCRLGGWRGVASAPLGRQPTLAAAPSSPGRSVLAAPAGVPRVPDWPCRSKARVPTRMSCMLTSEAAARECNFPGLAEPGRQGTASTTHSNCWAQGQDTRNSREAVTVPLTTSPLWSFKLRRV